MLEIWNQTQYDALLYMDSDVAVMRNLDHVSRINPNPSPNPNLYPKSLQISEPEPYRCQVLETMLASPALDEFRTPQVDA